MSGQDRVALAVEAFHPYGYRLIADLDQVVRSTIMGAGRPARSTVQQLRAWEAARGPDDTFFSILAFYKIGAEERLMIAMARQCGETK